MITRIIVSDQETAELYAAALALQGITCKIWPSRADGSIPLSVPRRLSDLQTALGAETKLVED